MRSQRLHPHQTLDTMQSHLYPERQHVVPHAPRGVSAVATYKALPYMVAQDFIISTAQAPRSTEPGVEPASRDIERLAHQRHWPGSSMFRQKAESHIDSFAK